MDREMQWRHLREAERHIAQGQRNIADQEARIADLSHNGHDTELARRLLNSFREIQAQHIAHRDFIIQQIEQ